MHGKTAQEITNSILSELHENDVDVMQRSKVKLMQRSSSWQGLHNIRNPFCSTTQNEGDTFKSNFSSLRESLAQSYAHSCSGIFQTLWYLFTPISRNVALFVGLVAIACRALQKVSEPVEMHLLQWHSSLINIHNTHLDLCTASNVHKNVLAVILTSVGWGAAESPKSRGGKLCCYALSRNP